MGKITAIIYALLMIWAYGSQIRTLFKKKKSDNLDLKFFLVAWVAVALRISTVGFIIAKTKNVSAIFLGIAELIVFFGLLFIAFQVIYYRYLKKGEDK